MFSRLKSNAKACFNPFRRRDRGVDRHLWSKDLERHPRCDFSFAVVQANQVLEDKSEVEVGPDGTFVGIYDGHGGPEAAAFVCDNLFSHLHGYARESRTISEGAISRAFEATENGYLASVADVFEDNPITATVGSCCLVGVIFENTLFVANLGDSRAVVGYLDRENRIAVEQLTKDHNACMDEVRAELRGAHLDDPHILVMRQGIWRIKGIIQISRSIGDAYLKRPEFAVGPSFPRFNVRPPITRSVLRADPEITTREIRSTDKFLIFASDGLWGQMSNEEAADIVHNNPREGIAKRLVVEAMRSAANRLNIDYNELKNLIPGIRRTIHDDITVVVMFLDHDEGNARPSTEPGLSIRGFVDMVGPSRFDFQRRVAAALPSTSGALPSTSGASTSRASSSGASTSRASLIGASSSSGASVSGISTSRAAPKFRSIPISNR